MLTEWENGFREYWVQDYSGRTTMTFPQETKIISGKFNLH